MVCKSCASWSRPRSLLHRAHFFVLGVVFLFQVVVLVEGDGVTKCVRRIGDGKQKAKSSIRLGLCKPKTGNGRSAIVREKG